MKRFGINASMVIVAAAVSLICPMPWLYVRAVLLTTKRLEGHADAAMLLNLGYLFVMLVAIALIFAAADRSIRRVLGKPKIKD